MPKLGQLAACAVVGIAAGVCGYVGISMATATNEPTPAPTVTVLTPGPTYIDPSCRIAAEELMTILTDGSAESDVVTMQKEYAKCMNP